MMNTIPAHIQGQVLKYFMNFIYKTESKIVKHKYHSTIAYNLRPIAVFLRNI